MTTELDKIRFHIRMLAEAIDHVEYPIPKLVVEFDWDNEKLNLAHNIFDRYDKALRKGEEPSHSDLENDFDKELQLNYQDVKSVVNAFYRNGQWTNVCYWYANDQDPGCPMELQHILMDKKI